MLLKEIVMESPLDIPSLDDHYLNDPLDNHFFYLKLYNSGEKVISEITKNIKMYEGGHRFYILDNKEDQVVYYLDYAKANHGLLGNYVYQNFVWSNPEYKQVTLGIPSAIVFSKLLPRYGTVATSYEQTSEGKDFWRRLIDKALKQNLNVYYIDLEKSKQLLQIHTIGEYLQTITKENVYGSDNATHPHKRFVISNKNLGN